MRLAASLLVLGVSLACSAYQPPLERSMADGTARRGRVEDVPVHGAWVELRPAAGLDHSEPIEGELLAIDPNTIFVGELGIIRAVPRAGIGTIWIHGRQLAPDRFAGLWEWARWPQGMPATLAESAVAPAE